MKFEELYDEMETQHCERALSEKYLKENGHQTAEEYGIGEYGYGIVTVPTRFVLPYFEAINNILDEDVEFCLMCPALNKCNGKCCFEYIKEMFREAEAETEKTGDEDE